MAQRKVKNGEKSPWGQCLTRPVPNGRRRSGFWLVPENFCVYLPSQKAERRRPFGTGLVRHCPQGLLSSFFTFVRAIFFRPVRLSLAPTICPWVSGDDCRYNWCTFLCRLWLGVHGNQMFLQVAVVLLIVILSFGMQTRDHVSTVWTLTARWVAIMELAFVRNC